MSRTRKPARPSTRFRPAVTPLEDRTTPATYTWDNGGGTFDWSEAANWTNNTRPPTSDTSAVVVFNSAGAGTTSVMNIAGLTVGQIRFESGSNMRIRLSTNLNMNGSAFSDNIIDNTGLNGIIGDGNLNLINSATRVRTSSSTGFLTISADITGSQGLFKEGTGTLALSTTVGGNSYSGETFVENGTLRVATNTGDQGISSTVTVGDGSGGAGSAVLELTGGTEIPDAATVSVRSDGLLRIVAGASEDFNNLSFSGGGQVGIAPNGNLTIRGGTVSHSGSSAATISGSGTLTLFPGTTFNVSNGVTGTDLAISSTITGSADLVKTGAGTLAISGPLSYTGLTRINGGTLLVGGTDAVAFTRNGAALVGEGSSGNDTFAFAPKSGFHDVVAQGRLLRFESSVVSVIVFRGNGGTDRADLFAAGSGNVAGLAATYGVLKGGSGYEVYTGNNMETVTVTGRPGDVGYLAGSEGSDTLVAAPTYATLSGTGFNNTVAGFPTVGAFGNGGADTAYLVGSTGNDNFVATPSYAGSVGSGFANYIAGFEGINASTGGGSDAAYLADSEQADTISASGSRATLTLPTVTVVVDGFVGVVAYGTNGGVNRKQVGPIGFSLELPGVWVG